MLANVTATYISLLGRLDAVYPSQTGGYSKKNTPSMKIGNRPPKIRYTPYMLRKSGVSPLYSPIYRVFHGYYRVYTGIHRYASIYRVTIGIHRFGYAFR
jgi:hypothetical protein